MKTMNKLKSSSIDLLCLAMAAGILLSLAVPGATPGSLTSGLRSILVPASKDQVDASYQADCLWFQARNHGFYGIQHQAVAGKATADEEKLWQAFLDSTGKHECGSSLTELTELMPALLASLPAADRHFMNPLSEPDTF